MPEVDCEYSRDNSVDGLVIVELVEQINELLALHAYCKMEAFYAHFKDLQFLGLLGYLQNCASLSEVTKPKKGLGGAEGWKAMSFLFPASRFHKLWDGDTTYSLHQ